jgi:hypothetical protein
MGKPEAKIENHLIAVVKRCGGDTRKITYQGRKGALDRMCVLPNGRLVFAECKAPGETPTALQQEELTWLRSMSCEAVFFDSKEDIDAYFA